MPEICDFCSSLPIRWSYPASTFQAFIGTSLGAWAACERCHYLIETGDRHGLMQRSLITLIAAHPEMASDESELQEHIETLHRMFFEKRTGPAVPYEAPVSMGMN